jgi:hypothetical protein
MNKIDIGYNQELERQLNFIVEIDKAKKHYSEIETI